MRSSRPLARWLALGLATTVPGNRLQPTVRLLRFACLAVAVAASVGCCCSSGQQLPGCPDAGAEVDAGPPCVAGAEPAGTWCDPTSGLMWQQPPPGIVVEWASAGPHCDALLLGDREDWRLPTICELRSLIRGCPNTMPGGACHVTDECLGNGCYRWDSCHGCRDRAGPGTGGCYWDRAFSSFCYGAYWSSSPYTGSLSSFADATPRVGSRRSRPAAWTIRPRQMGRTSAAFAGDRELAGRRPSITAGCWRPEVQAESVLGPACRPAVPVRAGDATCRGPGGPQPRAPRGAARPQLTVEDRSDATPTWRGFPPGFRGGPDRAFRHSLFAVRSGSPRS
jgi:hypothetical protein